ncbi:hypothetical protein [Saccharolobus islandicus]|uniref:hypothetical protein n=1 Tax=Saccharolobus islandicus TaxID=43080 RepID=UPI00064FC97D|nr:hypothetical protein [Sulfolobus islandicus]
MTSLLKTDWDNVERLIETMLNDHMRTWDTYNYFVIDNDMVLVKVYVGDRLVFTIKAKLTGDKLEVVEVS